MPKRKKQKPPHKIRVKGPRPSPTLIRQLVRMQERLEQGQPPRHDGHLIGAHPRFRRANRPIPGAARPPNP